MIRSSARDITERRRHEQALQRSEAQYRQAFEHAPVAVAHIGADGRYVRVNQALCELAGYCADELVGAPLSILVHPDDADETARAIAAAVSGELGSIRAERRIVRGDGTTRWVAVSGAVVRDPDGGISHLLVHYLDISDRKTMEDQLRHLADHDPLTELRNRRAFETELRAHVQRCARYQPAGALLMLDVDDFKHVNDTLGHPAGDKVIVAVARVLHRRLRGSDVLARLGGDEFAVLLPASTAEQAVAVAQSLIDAVRGEVILLPDGQPTGVTTSIGVAVIGQTRPNDVELLSHADIALYQAKRAGRDRYAVFCQPTSLPLDVPV